MDLSTIVSLLGALASIGAAVWIYTRQLRLELFEKRIAVYDATCAFLAHVGREGRPHTMEQLQTFLRETRNAEFLFKKEVDLLLKDVYKKGAEYQARYKVWEATPGHDQERPQRFEEQKACEKAINDMWEPVKSEFRGYLQLRRIW